MVMQGICDAPKGLPLRNKFINAIWETTPITNPVSRDYPPPKNTGWKSVALRVYRDPTLPRIRGARDRSIAAITTDWGESSRGWGQLDRGHVEATRATLTPLRDRSMDPEPTRRWRRRSYTRTQREFAPTTPGYVRFGPERSHINTDGTQKMNMTLGARPKTIA